MERTEAAKRHALQGAARELRYEAAATVADQERGEREKARRAGDREVSGGRRDEGVRAVMVKKRGREERRKQEEEEEKEEQRAKKNRSNVGKKRRREKRGERTTVVLWNNCCTKRHWTTQLKAAPTDREENKIQKQWKGGREERGVEEEHR